MRRVFATLIITASLAVACIAPPRESGSTAGASSTGATSTSGGSTTGGGGGVDGGALRGIACGDAGTCSADQFCLELTTTVAAGPATVQFSCDAAPSCNAAPTCDCFTSSDGGLCYDAHVQHSCDTSSGLVDCNRAYP